MIQASWGIADQTFTGDHCLGFTVPIDLPHLMFSSTNKPHAGWALVQSFSPANPSSLTEQNSRL